MVTNGPEVVAWRWRKPVVNDQGETVGATAWELDDAPEFLPWWTNEPLIRLSDYERLQAECEELSTALAESRANDRQAMAYLEAVRGIVGGDSFPEMIELVKELQIERNGYKLALKEWLEKSERAEENRE